MTTTAPQIAMPTPTQAQRGVPDGLKKIFGITMTEARIAEFDHGLRLLGWKSRSAWVAACVDAVIEQTEQRRRGDETPF